MVPEERTRVSRGLQEAWGRGEDWPPLSGKGGPLEMQP